MCTQDTHLHFLHALNLHMYPAHHYNHPDNKRTSGGMAIIVKDCICCIPVSLCALLQVIAVDVYILNLCSTLCNIYLPPAVPISPGDVTNLMSQLPLPFILLGDLNAKNILRGADNADKRGRSVYDVYAEFGLILLNTSTPTHLCLGLGTSSGLDLVFYSLGLAVHLD